MNATESPFITVPELASYIGMSRKFIEKHAQRGEIPGMKRFGRFVRFDKRAIERALLREQFLIKGMSK